MSNKETLQSYNTNLSENNNTLSSILETIKNLPESGGGSTPEVEPDYITDGLVSWWEGCDDLDGNNHWNSRVGTDYIYATSTKVGDTTTNIFGDIKTNNAYKNNMMYGLQTKGDYYIQDYTIEIVGKAFNVFNSSKSAQTSSSCAFIAFNKSGSPLIAVGFQNGLFFCLNVDASSSGKGMPTKIVNCVGKRHKYVIHLNEISARNTTGYNQINYSVNNSGWFAMNRTNMPSYSSNTALTNIMCYYSDNYYANGEINSIRIYNRKLTEEELLHNYEIDNARFKLDDYETQ